MDDQQQKRLDQLKAALASGAIDADTYESAVAGITVGDRGIAAQTLSGQASTGDGTRQVQTSTYVEHADVVYMAEQPVTVTAFDRASAEARYLVHVINGCRFLHLQGIRAGGKLVDVELDRVYVRLRTAPQRSRDGDDEAWLMAEAGAAPGERMRRPEELSAAMAASQPVDDVLTRHDRLIVLGDPGSGKTTLLRYLALHYARALAEQNGAAPPIGADEARRLPILISLRDVGRYLRAQPDDGADGHALLLRFLGQSLANERIAVPETFFDEWLLAGNAALLFDGLDEVADPELRRRVARLVESFAAAYPACRYVVTSRIVGYTGAARLHEGFATATVQDFTLADIEAFLTNWHRSLGMRLYGQGESADRYAADQTAQLMEAIRANPRIRELAINPLMLTVIAMVHRDRVRLPDRRAELYAEAVDVLLGKWDEARGVQETPILANAPFEASDKRVMLQALALHMHEQETREIDAASVTDLLTSWFADILGDERLAAQATGRFLSVIEARAGLFTARGDGVYAFSHLTFQEYLAALAVANRKDFVEYTLRHTPSAWWREVILLEAGDLSTRSRELTADLIRAIAHQRTQPAPYHNLVLAAECLRDVGENRVPGDLVQDVQRRLRKDIESPPIKRWYRTESTREWIDRRSRAMEALVRAGAGYWKPPYGEPEWVRIPAGEFWMGEGNDLHRVHLPDYWIARTPITNAQYKLFVAATGHSPPQGWADGQIPKGRDSHPVTGVIWRDAVAYCGWLAGMTHKPIKLPNDSEWEKAARGHSDQRAYPWGEDWSATYCNNRELELDDTTPVGIFPDGASPYGCLDMAGNVWEWTRSLWRSNSHLPGDGRDGRNTSENEPRALRGGAYWSDVSGVGCGVRNRYGPDSLGGHYGFRVVCAASPSTSVLWPSVR